MVRYEIKNTKDALILPTKEGCTMRLSIDDGKEKKNLAAPFQAEVVKFKDLTPKKKMEYIWDYHKWKIITISCTIILLCVIVPQIINNLKPTSLYVMMINSPWESEDADAMLEDFAAAEGIDTGKNKIAFRRNGH